MRSYFSVSTSVILTALTLSLFPTSSQAQLTYFSSRSLFNAAAPGLVTETLEAGTYSGSSATGALDKTTNNANFPPGSILDGLRLQAVGTTGVPGSGFNQYFYNNVSPFTAGNGTKVWTTNQPADSLDITFYNNNVTAAGLDIGASSTSGPSNYTIQIFGGSGALLDTQALTVASSSFVFFGFTSSQLISRINVAQPSWETVDNISFGSVNVTNPNAAPEPSSLALLVLSGPPVAGIAVRRRQQRRAA